jgi:hypothetical protein
MSSVSKDEVFWKILNSAVELDLRKGHLKWSLSELSRKSGITRSLIYYYLGKSREDILQNAIDIIGHEMFGTSRRKLEMWKSGQALESIIETREWVESHPYILRFYMVHRDAPTEVGKSLRAHEEKLIKKVSQYLVPSKTSTVSAKTVTAMMWGLTLAPGLTRAEVTSGFKALVAALA